MKRQMILIGLAVVMVLIVMAAGHSKLTTKPAMAQSSANYNLEWHVIGGGGHSVASANYVVNSTAGQGAASPPYSFGSTYVVSSGYWSVPRFVAYLYVPVVLRKH